MPRPLIWLILGCWFGAGSVVHGTAEPRIVAGRVVDAQGSAVVGAWVLLGRADPPVPFLADARAVTDAEGRYRLDLGSFAWGGDKLRSLVVARGYAAARGTIAASPWSGEVNFTVDPTPRRETEVRLLDPAGRPVAGLEWSCHVEYQVPWGQVTTDAAGRCRVAMAPDVYLNLQAQPPGVRPIRVYLSNVPEQPAAITVNLMAPVVGHVRDAAGQPVADAFVGRMILEDEAGKPTMLAPWGGGKVARTDRAGRFELAPALELSAEDWGAAPKIRQFPTTLAVADSTFERTDFRLIPANHAVGPLEITLTPGRAVTIPFDFAAAIPATPTHTVVEIVIPSSPSFPTSGPLVLSRRLAIATPSNRQATLVRLEPGSYAVNFNAWTPDWSRQVGLVERELVVPPGSAPYEAPLVTVELPRHQQMAGQPAPEFTAVGLDSGQPVHLADFRGKVVVLDFWGYWCGPCIARMPALVDLHARFAGQPVVVIGMHDEPARDRTEYDQRIASARKTLWENRDLPFPVLLDQPDPARLADRDREASGVTIERYAVTSFPTLFVIDQAGTLVAKFPPNQHDEIEAQIRTLLANPPAAGGPGSPPG